MVQENLKRFFYYINERHRIYLKREEGHSWPWTDDEILQTYSFCNVFRELDTVTQWIEDNWREPYADHPNLPFSMAVARQINWPETLEEIGFPEEWEPERVKSIMQARMDRGDKVYTGSYMLTGTLGGTKVEQTVDKILTPLYKNQPTLHRDSLEKSWREYLPYAGFSGFMAYEVVTDLRWTVHLQNADDIYSWANAGPGAQRGLNRIHGRPVNQTIKTHQLTEEMKDLLDLSTEIETYPSEEGMQDHLRYLAYWIDGLEMRDIEHCLCEYDKYERVRLGEGRPRAKYKYKGG